MPLASDIDNLQQVEVQAEVQIIQEKAAARQSIESVANSFVRQRRVSRAPVAAGGAQAHTDLIGEAARSAAASPTS
jgi:hypothetical protein